MNEEVKPCPFCGGEGKLKYLRSPWSGPTSRKEYHYVECCRCLAKTKPEPTADKAIASWNRRAS